MTSRADHHDRRSLRDVVAVALHDERANFESFVRSRVRPDEVDDIVQVAALHAMERCESLDDPERVVAWLYRIHRNLVTDTYRHRARDRRYFDVHAEPPEQPTMLGLPEAARRLDVSTNNATVRLHRARKALRQAMLDHCGVTDPRDCADCRCVYDACCAA